MKQIVSISAILILFFCSHQLQAQNTASSTDTLSVKVFFHCANGKALLEKRLGALHGVSSAYADLETKVVTVIHDPAVITREKILEIIEDQIGYTTEFTDPDKTIKKACSHGEGEEGHEH